MSLFPTFCEFVLVMGLLACALLYVLVSEPVKPEHTGLPDDFKNL